MNLSKRLGPVRPGLYLAILTLLFGIFMGVSFGVNEDGYKHTIKAGIAAHPEVHGKHAKKHVGKIWRYAQRSHFHATGIGAFTLGLILLLALTDMKACFKRAAAVLIGLGGSYPLAWFSMYRLSPSMGPHAAHEAWQTVLFTYVGVGGLLLGLLLLILHLLFGLFSSSSDDTQP
ncbi:MAG: hypothetical protein D6698_10495 [Gammaproteobacteria bacterium]|nr:MAG: hypothetical protein D6698_10495 [Gammaproteobacteria bacterium]